MRTKNFMQLLKTCVVFMMVCIIPISHAYSSTDNGDIKTDEEWGNENNERSLNSPTFTIHLNNGILSIQNANPIYDLNIIIINNVTGEEVYHTYISKEVSNYFTLPVSTLGNGEYCLTISNPAAGYVLAYFRL